MPIYDGVEVKIGRQIIAALAAAGGALIAGICLGWTALISDDIKDGAFGFELTNEEFSWIGSLFTLGGASVCIPIGFLISAIGRKSSMLLLVLPFTIGWLLILLSSNAMMLYIGRYMLGIAGGAFCITAPMYTGEISSKEIRGTLGSFFQLMITIGILMSFTFGGLLDTILFTMICTIIPIIFGIIFFFMPESPTYYVSKDKLDKAGTSLKWLRGEQYDPSREIGILVADREANKQSTSLIAALSRRVTLKSLFISLGLMFFQQMSGINSVIFYSGDIFKQAGTNPTTGTIIVGIVQVIVTFISTMIVDKLGRRILLFISGFVMMLCTLTLGVYLYLREKDKDSVDSLSWLSVVAVCIYIAMFSLGYGPVPWLMMGELFATDIKGQAGSISGTFNWLLAFVVTKTYGSMVDMMGAGQTFWLFSLFSLIGLLFVWLYVPETKNKSLQEIQAELGERN